MTEIFENRAGLDAFARTFAHRVPKKDDVTVTKGYLFCLYLAADRHLNKATYSLRNILGLTCSQAAISALIRKVVIKVQTFRKFPKECPKLVQFLQSTSNIPQSQATPVTTEPTATPKAAEHVASVSHSPPTKHLHTDCSKCDHRCKVIHRVVAEKKLLMQLLRNEKKKNFLNRSNAGRLTAYKLRHQLLVRKMRKEKVTLKREVNSLGKTVSKLTDESQIKTLKNELSRTKHCLRECKRRSQNRKHDTLESSTYVALEQQVIKETLLKKIHDLETERDMLKDELAELKQK